MIAMLALLVFAVELFIRAVPWIAGIMAGLMLLGLIVGRRDKP